MSDPVDPALQHLFVFAHQDDDLGYGGLLTRLSASAAAVYVTNGDGLAPAVGADPAAYAEMREAEGAAALAAAGIPRERVRFLGFSEIEIYDHLVDVTERPGDFLRIAAFFRRLAGAVAGEVARVRPDVVWTCAFQQGHPEHDLTHVAAALATRALGPGAVFCQLPQYELTILVPLRFAPWFQGEVQAIRLTPDETAAKLRMRDAYPSQVGLFRRFQRVIDTLGSIGRLAGRGFSFEEFAARETFAVLPPGFDYLHSTHPVEALNYMRDSHRGVKVRFDLHVRPIIAALLAGAPAAATTPRPT
ncbi:MAG: PIG-L family deacetylase [Deltaproteobacteria bacterium]|nr:PIG-L family deacetylase [Deltaproteobacteria bacterium]